MYLSSFLLIFTSIPQNTTIAESIEEVEEIEEVPEEAVLFTENFEDDIELYDSIQAIFNDEAFITIPDDTVVELIDTNLEETNLTKDELELLNHYSQIRYSVDKSRLTNEEISKINDKPYVLHEANGEELTLKGYVHDKYIVDLDDAEDFRKKRLEEHSEKELTSLEEKTNKQTKLVQSTKSNSITGLALKEPVHVYEETNRNSKVLKSYDYGSLLKFREHSDDWYVATVYINGVKHSGFIHTSDVGEKEQAKSVYGVALKTNTNVYAKKDRKSKVLKSYKKGHILKYKAHDKNWLSAVIYINGKRHEGFIYAKDVETSISDPNTLYGPAIKDKTHVYKRANTSSRLKSYKYGSYLKFKEFTSSWYQATIYIKGERTTGYIQKKDIGSMNDSLSGFAQKDPTYVYAERSKSSKSLKSYSIGTKLKYKPYDKNWYRATVINDGIREHGYIYAKDVDAKAPSIQGYAYSNPTIVYEKRSKSSKQLKSYPKGAKLKYRHYNKNWYIATVIINGKKYSGYVHKNDAGTKQPILYGYAHKSPTYIYSKNSTKSKKLKSYKKGKKLKFRYYNKNWYIARVYVNGKKHTGYIHSRDVGFVRQSNVVKPKTTYTYNRMKSDIKKLQEMYPDLIQYRVVGKSEYGRDIYAVGVGKGKATTFINGSIHAREWISTILNMYMIENYAKAYRNNSSIQGYKARSILKNTTIWFMPMVNPDGVTLQQSGLSAFPSKDRNKLIRYNNGSRNFKRWKANANGVDINRNFNMHWKTQPTSYPKSPSYQNYGGPRANSEKETQTVVNFVKEIRPQMTINYHSSGQVIYWKYRQSRSNMNRDYKYARQISRLTSYPLMEANNGAKERISGGGFLQYFTETYKLPSITPELGPYAGQTNVSPSKHFDKIWEQNRAVGLYAARESYKLYR